MTQWLNDKEPWEAPRSTADLFQDGIGLELIDLVRIEATRDACARHAFPAELRAEESLELGPLDDVANEEDFGYTAEELQHFERSMLEEIPLPGTPVGEANRRKEWLRSPRVARAAIRRLHATFGHCPNSVLIEILKNAKADEEYIKAAKHYRCDDCAITKKLPKQTSKVSLPKPYEFNHTIGLGIGR